MWDPASGERKQEIVLRYDLKCLAVNSTGSIAATNGPENETVIWSLRTGKELQRIVGHGGATIAIALSHDGNRIVTSRDDRTLCFYDVTNGNQLLQIDGNHGRANAVHLSGDDKQVVGAMSDGMVQIWDSHTGELQRSFRADQNEVLLRRQRVAIADGNGEPKSHRGTVAVLTTVGKRVPHVHSSGS